MGRIYIYMQNKPIFFQKTKRNKIYAFSLRSTHLQNRWAQPYNPRSMSWSLQSIQLLNTKSHWYFGCAIFSAATLSLDLQHQSSTLWTDAQIKWDKQEGNMEIVVAGVKRKQKTKNKKPKKKHIFKSKKL